MPAVVKRRPIEIRFKAGTPRRIVKELVQRYSAYVLPSENELVDYFESAEHAEISKRLTPGKSLAHLREVTETTQAALGKKLGVSAARISDWENGERGISKGMAKKLSGIFKVSPARFI